MIKDGIDVVSVEGAANLPYAISTPWMDAVLSGPLPARMVLMLQREAAERYMAPPGTKAFGAISIFLQAAFEVGAGHRVPAACFSPRPDVDSHLLHLIRQAAPFRFDPAVKALIRACFQQRRKQIGATLRKVMDSEIPLLLQGESGTGKEMLARFVHQKSARAGRPFVAINCAAIPPELLESELFGHEKGSFTGAHATVPGKFEAAGTGTIFLDEVGDMSLHLQTKLLRALEERSFEPVGSTRTIPLSARIVASTNGDLAAMIREKRFRLDLYYRLKGVALNIPPLRDRRDDIEPLLSIFLDSFRRRYNKPGVEISREAVRFLRTYQWPGNVRELKNAVESSVLLSDQNRPLFPQDFLLEGPGEAALPELWKQEREAIIEVLKRTGYNRSVASRELGMSRKTLYNKMKRYSIK